MTDKEILNKAIEHLENVLPYTEDSYLTVGQKMDIENAKEFIEWLKSISYEGKEDIQDMGQES